jgi:hypothetical protein
VERLLHSDVEILSRIAIHVLNERWSLFQDLYSGMVGATLFNTAHIHELHVLLRRRFDEFSDEQKDSTIRAIRDIQAPEGEDADKHLKRVQLRWMSALRDTTHESAKAWFTELQAQTGLAASSHPDFNSYSWSTVGPGPSPYQTPELVAFAEANELVAKLNAFTATGAWHDPTVDGLVAALEQAVAAAPGSFLRLLPKLVDLAPRYQHAVIQGFKKLWDSAADSSSFTWEEGWPELVSFFEKLVATPGLLESDHEGYPGPWTVAAIADFLRAGTHADDHAYAASLLPRTWSLIQVLLDKAARVDRPNDDDPMFEAINSTKGKVIEALFSHALRTCRLADKAAGSHDSAWQAVRSAFDAELAKCNGGNFEFSTLAGANLAQLDYMSRGWLHSNVARIFPERHLDNFLCAIGGLAYCVASRRLYVLLRDAGVVDRALQPDLKGREARKKLVERLMLGYLWEEDHLDSSRFAYLFSKGLVDDLETGAWFFWSVRGEQLSDTQRAKIVDYWERAVECAARQATPPAKLLAALGRLAWFLKTIDSRSRKLLLAVAPHMHRSFSVNEFLEDLSRLVEVNPTEVGEVVTKVIDASGPIYDYEDRLKALIKRLAELGQKTVAIDCCNKVITMPGMDDVFRALTS